MLVGFIIRAINWNLADRQNVSFQTSAHAGVGISIEFQVAYRHTVYSILPFSGIFHKKWYVYPGDCHTSLRTGSE